MLPAGLPGAQAVHGQRGLNMKLSTLIIGLALLVSALPSYAGGIVMMGGGVADAVASSTYVGWANSDGTPTGTPSNTSVTVNDDEILTTRWVATEAGTAKSIQVYRGGTWAADGAWVALYRDISGTITLVGKGIISGTSTSTWSGKITLTAESGQSLDFSQDDVLYFGVAVYDVAGSSSQKGRNDTGGTGMYYQAAEECVTSGGPPATTTFANVSGRLMAFILEYE